MHLLTEQKTWCLFPKFQQKISSSSLSVNPWQGFLQEHPSEVHEEIWFSDICELVQREIPIHTVVFMNNFYEEGNIWWTYNMSRCLFTLPLREQSMSKSWVLKISPNLFAIPYISLPVLTAKPILLRILDDLKSTLKKKQLSDWDSQRFVKERCPSDGW